MLLGPAHLTLRVADLDRSQMFYERTFDLTRAGASPLPMPGRWLLSGRRPIIRLLEADVSHAPGTIEQVALAAQGRARLEQRLAAAGIAWQLRALPDGSALQMLLADPDGARLELMFRSRADR